MELIKHETFNIYGDRKEIEALKNTVIAENELFVRTMDRLDAKKFIQGIGDTSYFNVGKYNGKAVQLIVSYKENVMHIMYDGKEIGYAYSSKSKETWVVKMFDYNGEFIEKVYTGKKGNKGREIVKQAIMADSLTMYETYLDAYQYYIMSDDNSYTYEDDESYEYHLGISSGCSNCGDGGCLYCEPNRFL